MTVRYGHWRHSPICAVDSPIGYTGTSKVVRDFATVAGISYAYSCHAVPAVIAATIPSIIANIICT